jgi:amino acid adenylation domain-containing protein
MRCIPDLFEAQAKRKPHAIAVVFEDQSLTYDELAGRSNQLARYLKTRGIGPDVLVGVCVDRSLEMMVGLLGVLKAGGAYVPLDPTFPMERLAYMVRDANVEVLLTQEQLVQHLPTHQAQVVRLDADWRVIAGQSRESLDGQTKPDHLAYVIYTSGSTGQPKGVQVTHGAVVNFLESMRQQPGLEEEDVLVAVTTLSFDIAGLELYLPLAAGARVVVLSREAAADASQLAAWLDKTKATIMQATPAAWRLLLNGGWLGNKGLKILCGGETLPRSLASQLRQRARSVWNLYGPTETTIWSTLHQVESLEGPVPIGIPIANTTVHLLGADWRPVPPGQAGELHIGGAGLARGYRNRPDLTAEKFIPDPFSAVPGARLYKTGDLARLLPDGTLDCLGRIDHQVKIRGYRIELGEIEAVLTEHPAVREAVVIAREDIPGDKRLVAYVVLREVREARSSELRRFLKDRLPDYMVPSVFETLEGLPLTPNGKVDRLALPPPDWRRELDREHVVPRNVVEVKLAKILESILGIGPIGVTDDFFDLGVHSLTGARVFTEIEKSFGKKLPPSLLFEAPTVEQLAFHLGGKEDLGRWTSLIPIQPHGARRPLFCVHGGAGTIFPLQRLAQHLGPDQPFYGLQMQGLYGIEPPHARVEEMAAHYLKEMRSLQPEGPYLVGGYCFGGIVAFEMAQRLQQLGEQVALLVLFNAPSPIYIRRQRQARANSGGVVSSRWEKLRLRGKKQKFRYLINTLKAALGWRIRQLPSYWRDLRYKIRGRRQQFYLRRKLPIPEALRNSFFLEINQTAEILYEPQAYAGAAILFCAQGLYKDPLLGWEGLFAEGIKVHQIAGKHINQRTLMQEPLVQQVADPLKKYLNEAEGRTIRQIVWRAVDNHKEVFHAGPLGELLQHPTAQLGNSARAK